MNGDIAPHGLESTYREEGKQEGRNRMLQSFFRKFFLFFLLGIPYIGPFAAFLLSIILISETAVYLYSDVLTICESSNYESESL